MLKTIILYSYKVDLLYGIDISPDPPLINNKILFGAILSIYSPKSDFGMDEGLKLHPLQGLLINSF